MWLVKAIQTAAAQSLRCKNDQKGIKAVKRQLEALLRTKDNASWDCKIEPLADMQCRHGQRKEPGYCKSSRRSSAVNPSQSNGGRQAWFRHT